MATRNEVDLSDTAGIHEPGTEPEPEPPSPNPPAHQPPVPEAEAEVRRFPSSRGAECG